MAFNVSLLNLVKRSSAVVASLAVMLSGKVLGFVSFALKGVDVNTLTLWGWQFRSRYM